ncbi:hypothetical protein RvY_03787 [Ramazzottius varieornatus]|uniref:Uncharacterized protein n=1 Tax=Ramazzottius varieornatus TaxID=947166 RepID=A0A1D1UZG1_RAMVA|nr:hypothetical protein RvY_03787 [Ramazzottius varieornatus]
MANASGSLSMLRMSAAQSQSVLMAFGQWKPLPRPSLARIGVPDRLIDIVVHQLPKPRPSKTGRRVHQATYSSWHQVQADTHTTAYTQVLQGALAGYQTVIVEFVEG